MILKLNKGSQDIHMYDDQTCNRDCVHHGILYFFKIEILFEMRTFLIEISTPISSLFKLVKSSKRQINLENCF